MLRLLGMIPAVLALATPASGQMCEPTGMHVQVLGSGGPRINPARASASYLVWVGGRAAILVDAGGGAFLRFGEAGGRLEDLPLIARGAGRGVPLDVIHLDGTGPEPLTVFEQAGVTVTALSVPHANVPTLAYKVQARAANARRLVLSHIGAFDLAASVAEVKKEYSGPVIVSSDLQCVSGR